MEHLPLLILGLTSFVATGLDEVFILLAFFSDPKFSYKKVVIGQYLGVLIVIAISGLAYFLKMVIPTTWLGLLGIVPICIGLKQLLTKRDANQLSPEDLIQVKTVHYNKFFKNNSEILLVMFISVANGLDSVGVYAPLFASLSLFEALFSAVMFLVLTGVICLLPYFIINNPFVGNVIRKYVYYLLPFILIGLGMFILIENETLSLFF